MKLSQKYKIEIKNKIKQAKFREALDQLEEFVEQLNDDQLSVRVLALHARFSTEFKNNIDGLKSNPEEQNKIIYALTQLLKEAEALSIQTGSIENNIDLGKINLEILDRYSGVYENYYLNDVGNQNFISRNVFQFYNDGTVKLKNFKNIIYTGKISPKLEGRFFVLSDFKDKDGNEYDFMSILRLPWVADEETELVGIYAGISHSSVIPKAGRDYFRRVNGIFDSISTKKIHLENKEEMDEVLSQIPHLKDFFIGKYEYRDTHKFIDIIR